jgi:hypothetical protein
VTTRRKSLMARWGERPFEQKMAILAGVLVPLVVGVIVPIVLARDGEPQYSPARLEVVNLVAKDGSVSEKPSEAAAIEVTLRNTGGLVSVIKRVELRVRDFLLIKSCGPHGAPLDISARYQAQLPAYDAAGRTVIVDVSQQLRPMKLPSPWVHHRGRPSEAWSSAYTRSRSPSTTTPRAGR